MKKAIITAYKIAVVTISIFIFSWLVISTIDVGFDIRLLPTEYNIYQVFYNFGMELRR